VKTFSIGGIHPRENKLSAGKKIEIFPLPDEVIVSLSQHMGAPAQALVDKKMQVKVGQLIGKANGFISANIHSPVSGTITKIEEMIDSSGYRRPAIIIKVEGDEWMPEIDRSATLNKEITLDREAILNRIAEAGIVGLGGATFPTHVKLRVPAGKNVHTLFINAVECEPYLTSDHVLMLEKGAEIIVGCRILMKALGIDKTIIGIEANKPDAIAHLTKLATMEKGIYVVSLKVRYPQGGEKQLIEAILGEEVPSGGLPMDVGVVVQNIGTTFAVYEAVQKNKPLFERVVTVTGKILKNPSNLLVRVGTPVAALVNHCGGSLEKIAKVINGGPMMGKALTSLEVPVIKGMSGLLVLEEKETARGPEGNCIRCGKCVSVCCMGLEPYLLAAMGKKSMWEKISKKGALDCVECGSCSYTCPADVPILDYIRLGKNEVRKLSKTKK
jgi:electron transport complex protein RnfC